MRNFEVLAKTEDQKNIGKAALAYKSLIEDFGAIEGEYTKDELEIEHVNMANSFLMDEVSRLDLEKPESVELSRVHFLDKEAWDKKFQDDAQGHATITGAYINNEDIMTDALENNISYELKRFAVLLHESIHLLGHRKYLRDEESNTTHDYRSGYVTHDTENEKYYFEMFNEGIVDTLVCKILGQHKEEIKNMFDVDLDNWDEFQKYLNHTASIARVYDIVLKISEDEKSDTDQIWDELMKNHFTGNMMFLRKIEKIYGPGSLRLLAEIDFSENDNERQIKLKKYFLSETTDEERKILALELVK